MSSDPSQQPAESASDKNSQVGKPDSDRSIAETHGWGSSVGGLPFSGPNGRGLKIRCPHCHSPIEIVADDSLQELTCPSCGSNFSIIEGQSSATSAKPTVRKLGQFELVEQLGVGAFGTVWKARDTELDRVVAIKIPRRDQLGPDEIEQFFREARASAQLRHPNIVSVHEVGRDGGTVYIVSDLIRGVTLTEWLTGQQPTPREAAEICAQIATALHHAHERGVIHRDLKPGNVMLDGDGQIHIMDFGLAKREAGEITMTVEGRILGTPAYMSPEQARGEGHTVDRRTDVYSLGVILFQLLTGELPFRGTPRLLIYQVLHDEPRSLRSLNDRIPRDLETICLKAMAKEPTRRYATSQELAEDLNRWLNGEPIKARPVGRLERGWRWVKRNRLVAMLMATIVIATSVGVVASAFFAANADVNRRIAEESTVNAIAQKVRADKKATEAITAADDANRQRDRLRHALYVSNINLAQRSWETDDVERVRELLTQTIPQENKRDLRGWEWHYQQQLCECELRTLSSPGKYSPSAAGAIARRRGAA